MSSDSDDDRFFLSFALEQLQKNPHAAAVHNALGPFMLQQRPKTIGEVMRFCLEPLDLTLGAAR